MSNETTPEPPSHAKSTLSPFEAAFQITLGILSASGVAAIVVGVLVLGFSMQMFTLTQLVYYSVFLLAIGVVLAGLLIGLFVASKWVEGWRARRSQW